MKDDGVRISATNPPPAHGLECGLAHCLAPASEARSLPPACYVSDAWRANEIEKIFRRGWIGLGRADQIAEPGGYMARDIAGAPLLLIRDKLGVLRAFANTCRHRGARLLEGAGEVGGVRCPFHCWAYALDGRLIAAPRMEEAPGFDKSEYGLREYPLENRAGFLFVSFERSPPDLDAQLGDFEALHASWPLASLKTTMRREFVVDCNWKNFLDVFNEYYHLPFVHADSIDDVYEDPAPGDAVTGAFASQYGRTSGTGGLLQDQQQAALPRIPGLTGAAAHGVRYSWVFPNMTFAAGTDAVWLYEAYPDPASAGRCRVTQSICFPSETIAAPDFDEKAAMYHHRLDAALEEDLVALENQQRGLESPDATQGRFCEALEPNVAAFARWYAGRFIDS